MQQFSFFWPWTYKVYLKDVLAVFFLCSGTSKSTSCVYTRTCFCWSSFYGFSWGRTSIWKTLVTCCSLPAGSKCALVFVGKYEFFGAVFDPMNDMCVIFAGSSVVPIMDITTAATVNASWGAHHALAQAIDPAVPTQSVQEGGWPRVQHIGCVTSDDRAILQENRGFITSDSLSFEGQ